MIAGETGDVVVDLETRGTGFGFVGGGGVMGTAKGGLSGRRRSEED